MYTPSISLLLILLGADAAPAVAQAPPHPAEIAPWLEPFARAVVRIDLKNADLVSFLALVAPKEAMPLWPDSPPIQALQQAQSAVLDAGIDRVYFVVSLADMPIAQAYLVAPCNAPPDIASLLAKVPKDLPEHLQVPGGIVPHTLLTEDSKPWFFVGTEATYQRLLKRPGSQRPELVQMSDSPLSILLLPAPDDRRVVEELLPALPDSLGGGPGTVVTRGVLWAVVHYHARPEPSIHLQIQSADQAAAEKLRDVLVRGVVSLNQWQSRTDLAKIVVDPAQAAEVMPKVEGDRLVLDLRASDGSLPAFHRAFQRPIARLAIEKTATGQLRQIVHAMHLWHDKHNTFPAQASFDARGKPLLSWRVHILPFLGDACARLYGEFHLDEPWDSQHNLKQLAKMPGIYAIPGSRVAGEGRTCYLRPLAPGTSCPPDTAIGVADIPDGTSNTVAIVEADDQHAVPWTKPADLNFDSQNPAEGLGGHLEGAVFSVFCDGSPYILRDLVSNRDRAPTLRALFTRAGGELVGPPD